MSQYISKLGLGDLPGWFRKIWSFWPGANLRTPKYEASAVGSETFVTVGASDLTVWSGDASEVLCDTGVADLTVWSGDASEIVFNCE